MSDKVGRQNKFLVDDTSKAMKRRTMAKPTKAVIVHPKYQHTLPMEPIQLSFWEQCCDEVLANIASKLEEHQSLVNLQLTNHRCRRVADRDDLWRKLSVLKFNTPPYLRPEAPKSWKDVYRFNHEAFKYLLAQSAAEALMQLGIRASSQPYIVHMQRLAA
eukprot:GHRR01006544.1.p1 GENE.GHRR01006544.1~~GHRR01006544.1.p1  ORF type:complete len:160 (+),score=31.50 GHRR01006544.1:234-713(+)